MIKLNVNGHDEMCGGYAYSGIASFEGHTVKEVLEEIKEFAKDEYAEDLGDGFGNPECRNKCGCAWEITIGGEVYKTSWIGHNSTYNHEYDDCIVKRIRVSGGWYCFYNFDIEVIK